MYLNPYFKVSSTMTSFIYSDDNKTRNKGCRCVLKEKGTKIYQTLHCSMKHAKRYLSGRRGKGKIFGFIEIGCLSIGKVCSRENEFCKLKDLSENNN